MIDQSNHFGFELQTEGRNLKKMALKTINAHKEETKS